ncbi:MAG: hypothetical protein J7496_15515 [Novosphingobium sp.]|nr:hypothetical protein [Novosphingobium sp.]MBO9603910.1 hypothetical protein [Novosphingobium sp.]
MTRSLAALCAALSLAACHSEQPAASPTETASPTLAATPTPSATSTRELQIPAAIRGRWGLVPADCTSTKGDNKGLILIDAESMTFYESHAMLDVVKEVRESRVVASFDFSGEGQTWKMEETLELASDGNQLIRTEKGENATTEPLRYTRCA